MIYEQILALLVSKFSGVRKDGLEQVARVLALQCSGIDEAKNIVDKLTEAQVGEFTKDFRKIVDKEVSESNKTFEANLKKKYDLVERKSEKETGKEVTEQKPDDIATIVAGAVANAVKPLQERLNKYEQGEVGKSRLQALEAKLSGCKDETFKTQTLKDFARMSFADDNAFTEYLTEKEADIKTANQSLADANLRSGAGAPMMAQKTEDGVSKAVADYIASQKPDANALSGKEV